MEYSDLLLAVLIALTALLYSSVGHGGASGYIAAMVLVGLAPTVIRPSALTLNILVASVTAVQFYRVGSFSWRLFIPLSLASIPMAFVGGMMTLPSHYFKVILGMVLIYAAWRSFYNAKAKESIALRRPNIPTLIIVGGALGWLSGITGVGGGIFLSPLLFIMRWESVRTISGISAAFIGVNSIAGLLGGITTQAFTFPPALPLWALCALIGGFFGSYFGAKRLPIFAIRRFLAIVLLLAGIKLLLS